jgi:hypothetical protein
MLKLERDIEKKFWRWAVVALLLNPLKPSAEESRVLMLYCGMVG